MVFPNGQEKRQAKKFVVNPESRRLIVVNGPAFKRLLTKYTYDEKRNIFIIPKDKRIKDPSGKIILINGSKYKILSKLGYTQITTKLLWYFHMFGERVKLKSLLLIQKVED